MMGGGSGGPKESIKPMTRKRQKLMAVQVTASPVTASPADAASPAILPLEGGSIEDLLAAWRVVQIQPLGPLPAAESGGNGRYVALLLLEEIPPEEGAGRLGFAAP
jgi:hypothetical protein